MMQISNQSKSLLALLVLAFQAINATAEDSSKHVVPISMRNGI